MTLEPLIRSMLNERVDVLEPSGSGNVDEYGNVDEPWVTVTNPDSTDGKWAAGFDLTASRGFEDATDIQDLGTTVWDVIVEPDASLSRKTRLQRADGTVVALQTGGKITDRRGFAHWEWQAVEIT